MANRIPHQLLVLALLAVLAAAPSHAEMSAEELAIYNVVHPDYGANWQLRAQVQLMFPK